MFLLKNTAATRFEAQRASIERKRAATIAKAEKAAKEFAERQAERNRERAARERAARECAAREREERVAARACFEKCLKECIKDTTLSAEGNKPRGFC